MNMNLVATAVRNLLIALSGIMIGLGLTTESQWKEVVDQVGVLLAGLGALFYLVTTGWQMYVNYKVTLVPDKTAERADVPTVSSVTGQVERTAR